MRRHALSRSQLAWILTFGLVTACAPHGTVMRHPLQYGTVDQNTAVVNQRREEQRTNFGEGVLYDDASISKLDANSICFQVRVRRSPQTAKDLVDLARWEMVVRPDNGGAIGVRSSFTPFAVTAVGVRNLSGAVARVETHGGEVCFAHAGRVSLATRSITLDIRGHGTRARFAWRFGNAPSPASTDVPPPAPTATPAPVPAPTPDPVATTTEPGTQTPPPASATGECTGTFDAPVSDVIAAMQRQANPEVERCFAALRKRETNASGNLQVVLTVFGNGRVAQAQVNGTPADATFRGCIQTKAVTWTFPAVVNGSCAVLVAPFALVP